MQLIECPRDAMQGIKEFIPTITKIAYLNKLLSVGFHTLDFGSFVSPKAIPQLSDTKAVLQGLDLSNTKTKLLAIIANVRGAKEALSYPQISYLGYPLSISETFQQRNTNKSIANALEDVAEINELCRKHSKELVVYISMGFGNPYNDPFSIDYLQQFIGVLATLGIENISISDTIGIAQSAQIEKVFSLFSTTYAEINLGAHLHSNLKVSSVKIKAALKAGCRRFDGAILGYGGCPMAEDDLVGNMDTRIIISEIQKRKINLGLDMHAFKEAENYASKEIFGRYQ